LPHPFTRDHTVCRSPVYTRTRTHTRYAHWFTTRAALRTCRLLRFTLLPHTPRFTHYTFYTPPPLPPRSHGSVCWFYRYTLRLVYWVCGYLLHTFTHTRFLHLRFTHIRLHCAHLWFYTHLVLVPTPPHTTHTLVTVWFAPRSLCGYTLHFCTLPTHTHTVCTHCGFTRLRLVHVWFTLLHTTHADGCTHAFWLYVYTRFWLRTLHTRLPHRFTHYTPAHHLGSVYHVHTHHFYYTTHTPGLLPHVYATRLVYTRCLVCWAARLALLPHARTHFTRCCCRTPHTRFTPAVCGTTYHRTLHGCLLHWVYRARTRFCPHLRTLVRYRLRAFAAALPRGLRTTPVCQRFTRWFAGTVRHCLHRTHGYARARTHTPHAHGLVCDTRAHHGCLPGSVGCVWFTFSLAAAPLVCRTRHAGSHTHGCWLRFTLVLVLVLRSTHTGLHG